MTEKEIRSRDDAADRNLKRYFTGRPCKYGHVSERYVLNGACCECVKYKARAHYLDVVEKRGKQLQARIEGLDYISFNVPRSATTLIRGLIDGAVVPAWEEGYPLTPDMLLQIQALIRGKSPLTAALHPDDAELIGAIIAARKLMETAAPSKAPPLPLPAVESEPSLELQAEWRASDRVFEDGADPFAAMHEEATARGFSDLEARRLADRFVASYGRPAATIPPAPVPAPFDNAAYERQQMAEWRAASAAAVREDAYGFHSRGDE